MSNETVRDLFQDRLIECADIRRVSAEKIKFLERQIAEQKDVIAKASDTENAVILAAKKLGIELVLPK